MKSNKQTHRVVPQIQLYSTEESYSEEECEIIKRFWNAYDEIIILSIFSILGIIFRLLAANFFSRFNDVFNESSALFTNLPLNCLSCFLMGLLCSGENAMKIVRARYGGIIDYVDGSDGESSETGDGDQEKESDLEGGDGRESSFCDDVVSSNTEPQRTGLHRRRWNRRRNMLIGKENKHESSISKWADRHRTEEEMREVQLMALERRIRASSCLFLFPAKKKSEDVVEHYMDPTSSSSSSNAESSKIYEDKESDEDADFQLVTVSSDDRSSIETTSSLSPLENQSMGSSSNRLQNHTKNDVKCIVGKLHQTTKRTTSTRKIITEATNKIVGARINVADGWDVGTSAEAMKDGILLGLRVGFCGAVSTFSSWNSDMVNLLKNGSIDAAFVGYLIGLQLPIVSYRLGQHISIYSFVWRCRRESKRDDIRGYGLRVALSDDSSGIVDEFVNVDGNTDDIETTVIKTANSNEENEQFESDGRMMTQKKEVLTRKTPSLRAIATATIAMTVMCLLSSIFFFGQDLRVQRFAISLLFTPFGVLGRWKLNGKLNAIFPSFPLGTFICNIFAVALSGSLGSLLAGNPGPEERIFLVSVIAGFAGSLSTLATFLVEILDRIEPILFKFDGVQYAGVTLFWAIVIGLLGSQAKNWADEL